MSTWIRAALLTASLAACAPAGERPVIAIDACDIAEAAVIAYLAIYNPDDPRSEAKLQALSLAAVKTCEKVRGSNAGAP